jgi:hypothetical protein
MFGKLFDAWRKRGITKSIERHGWTALYVGDYSTAPAWAYTIGFQSLLGAPEIIVFDIPEAAANALFHEICREIEAGDLNIRDGERWRPHDGVMVWRKVHPSRFVDDPENPWFGLAFYIRVLGPGSPEFEAYQLVLSDAEGKLPWEPGYDERLRPLQRALWEPAELAPAAAV